jgi:hypothetical protein
VTVLVIQEYGGGNVKKRDNLDDLSIDGKIILKCIFKN